MTRLTKYGYIVRCGGWRTEALRYDEARRIAAQYRQAKVVRVADGKVCWVSS